MHFGQKLNNHGAKMSDNTQNSKFQNKLQIKARLLSAIINLQQNSQNKEFVNAEMEELETITDKSAIFEVLKKEFFKENTETRDYTITFLIQELIEQEIIEKSLFEDLANPKINDKIKTKIIGLLRETGKHVSYEDYTTYFSNPDEIIDSDTERLLENAKINPESQIDFLDFLTALPEQEKELLVNSLTEDYDGDNLTNILIPLIMSNPYSDIAQHCIKAIGESKSKLAFPILAWLKENIDDTQVQSNVQKSISLLKLSGIKEDETKEYYKKILSIAPVYTCLASYPDGHGNIGIIFSRRNDLGLIQMFALVVNDVDGIIDCFGFNEISDNEFGRIVGKFYQQNIVAEVNAEFCKYIMLESEKITRLKYQVVPYEYVAWKMITNDIEPNIPNLKEDLSLIEVNEFLLKQLAQQGYFDRCFFTSSDSSEFATLINKIEKEKITDCKTFEQLIIKEKDNIFNNTTLSLLNNRLLISAYFAKNEDQNIFANTLYSLIENSEIKEYFKIEYIKKSIYQHFLAQRDKYESLKNATSIFTRKTNKDLNAIDIKYIQTCINNIEEYWT